MDAKIFAMIDDLSRDGLIDAHGDRGLRVEASTQLLRYLLRRGYEVGNIPASDIAAAWENDTAMNEG